MLLTELSYLIELKLNSDVLTKCLTFFVFIYFYFMLYIFFNTDMTYMSYQCYTFNGGDETSVIVIRSISTNESQ